MSTTDENNTAQAQISKIALQAANAFESGNVIAGTGIAGILMIVLAAVALGIGFPWEASPTPKLYFGALFGLVGTVFIFISGSLYRMKATMRSETMMLLAKGYIDISLKLAENVNPKTVAADDITNYAEKYIQSVSRLLEDPSDAQHKSRAQISEG